MNINERYNPPKLIQLDYSDGTLITFGLHEPKFLTYREECIGHNSADSYSDEIELCNVLGYITANPLFEKQMRITAHVDGEQVSLVKLVDIISTVYAYSAACRDVNTYNQNL